MGRLVYKGPTKSEDASSEFHVRDEGGEMHRLIAGQVSDELPDSLASELLKGSARTKGHKFEEATEEQLKAAGIEAKASRSQTAGSGSGGSSPAPGSGSATGTTPTA
jgi:hypothetical protein